MAGAAAGTAQRHNRRNRAAGGPPAGAAGGGSTADTTRHVRVAGGTGGRDTLFMAVPNKRGSLIAVMVVLAFSASALSARADEFKLKGGRKLYGVIVSYEDNMFKIKTEFGYELIEKDKIESIIPSTPGAKSEPGTAAKKDATSPKTEGRAPPPHTPSPHPPPPPPPPPPTP